MYYKDLQSTLQNLKKQKITLEKIGEALDVKKATVSLNMKNPNKLVRPDEIEKLEKYFNVSFKQNCTNVDIDSFLKSYQTSNDLTDKQIALLKEFLETPEMINALFLFVSTVKGDKDALDVLKMINSKPSLLKVMYYGSMEV